MHHKVIIIDGEIVVIGSYNFSTSADEENDENVLIIHSPAIAAQFEAEFQRVYETALNPPKKD
jgi:phosphatidylserine/phosphatidylglycerophosphate/cardiolipin synthase-like enzyme